jgi:hypothetical protein
MALFPPQNCDGASGQGMSHFVWGAISSSFMCSEALCKPCPQAHVLPLVTPACEYRDLEHMVMQLLTLTVGRE